MADEICSYEACDELAIAECSCSSPPELLCRGHVGDHITKISDSPHKVQTFTYGMEDSMTESILSVLNKRKNALMKTKKNFFSTLKVVLTDIQKLVSKWNLKMNQCISEVDEIMEEVSLGFLNKKKSKIPGIRIEKLLSYNAEERKQALNNFELEPQEYEFANTRSSLNDDLRVLSGFRLLESPTKTSTFSTPPFVRPVRQGVIPPFGPPFPASGSTKWRCNFCTFQNNPNELICEMCNKAQPQKPVVKEKNKS